MSRCNRALVKGDNELKLIQTICNIFYASGHYEAVWVGFARNDKEKNIEQVAIAGNKTGFLTKVKVSWGNSEFGRGPSGTAIRTGRPCMVTISRHNRQLSLWMHKALVFHLRAAISLPLINKGKTFGVLTLYSYEPHAFDGPQAGLLKEMADNLAFGIIALRAGRERDSALEELRQKNEQLRALAMELTTAEERERRRMAVMLHDQLQQQLVGVRYNVQFLQSLGKGRVFRQIVNRIDGTLKDCLDRSRLLTAELSPRVLFELGLGPAIKWLAGQYQEKQSLKITVHTMPTLGIPEDIAITLFQAVRELLFNVVKHANAKTASVRLTRTRTGEFRVIVSDDGDGFDPARLRVSKTRINGFGLFSLRERLASMGGELNIDSAPSHGARITVSLPMQPTAKLRDKGRARQKPASA